MRIATYGDQADLRSEDESSVRRTKAPVGYGGNRFVPRRARPLHGQLADRFRKLEAPLETLNVHDGRIDAGKLFELRDEHLERVVLPLIFGVQEFPGARSRSIVGVRRKGFLAELRLQGSVPIDAPDHLARSLEPALDRRYLLGDRRPEIRFLGQECTDDLDVG